MSQQTNQLLNNQYYKRQNNSYYLEYSKEEIKKMIDIYDESTFLPFLKELDYPYIQKRWERMRNRWNNSSVFGRYIALMRLASYRVFTWSDSQMLNQF